MQNSHKTLAQIGAEYFDKNYDALFKQYGAGVYVLRGEQVEGVYSREEDAFRDFSKIYPDLDFATLECDIELAKHKVMIPSFCTQLYLDNL